MSTMNRSGFADLMSTGLFEVISLKYKEFADQYSQIFNVKTSTKKFEQGSAVEGPGAASEKSEGNSISYSALTQGYDTTWTHKTYAIGGRVTREAYDDDQYSIFKTKLGTYLARSMKQRWEIQAANVLNNAFSAAYTGAGQTGGDTAALCSVSHTYASGGTWANKPATDVDLSHAGLEAMITLADTAKEAGSVPVVFKAQKLIIAPANRWTASVILDSQLKSGTGNNDTNVLKSIVTPVVNSFLTDADAWFVQTDYNPLIFWERQKPTMEATDDFDTKDAKITLVGRCSAGYDDPNGFFGSSGG